MSGKCFSTFNGYEVKDAQARENIKHLNNFVTPQMFGAVGDGVADDSAALQSAFSSGKKVCIPKGIYKVTQQLNAFNSIYCEPGSIVEFYPSDSSKICIQISGSLSTICTDIGCTIEGYTMTVKNAVLYGVAAGDYVRISNSDLVSTYAREYDTKREILEIASVSGNVITFVNAPEFDYETVTIEKCNFAKDVEVSGLKIECKNVLGYTYGLFMKYCFGTTVHGCSIKGFDYSQIELDESIHCRIYGNYCQVDYYDQLQYGIVVNSSFHISVYGNTVNSRRTAIDATRMSQYVTISNNACSGNINTHSASNIVITGNVINEGMILIRGNKVTVSNNNVRRMDYTCIDIEEMGIEGDIVISGNTFRGCVSMKIYDSNIKVVNNSFMVEKVSPYGSFESVICGVWKSGTSKKGFEIVGNTIIYEGDTPPKYCIEFYSGLNTINNVRISGNKIHNFERPLYLAQMSGALGSGLIVENNELHATVTAITFRICNDVKITGNVMIGIGDSAASYGIYRYEDNVGSSGLMIKNNYFRNFGNGISITQGTGYIENACIDDNVFVDVETKEVTSKCRKASRATNKLFMKSPNGTVYEITVSDEGDISVN